MKSLAVILSLALFLAGTTLRAETQVPAEVREVAIEQRLGAQVPLATPFRDDAATPVRLSRYFKDKPVILVFAYFRCPRLCSEVLRNMVESLRKVALEPGVDFQVVVVSFDHREGPALAKPKKKVCVEEYGRPETADGWHFLTGREADIRSLADAVGFRYIWDSSRDEYRHASGIMVLTPQGKIARYFFGIDYPPQDIRLGLVEAADGRIGSPVDQALLLTCLSYDAAAGKYLISPMKLMRLAAGLTVLIVGGYLVRTWLRDRRANMATLAVKTVEH